MNQAVDKTELTIDPANTANVTGILLNTSIVLSEGEQWAGILLGKNGEPDQHIILLPGEPETRLNHADATAWAIAQGGELPTRREQSLLFANLKEAFKEDWYWSSETHAAIADYAWFQGFGYGDQSSNYERGSLHVRAVRRQAI